MDKCLEERVELLGAPRLFLDLRLGLAASWGSIVTLLHNSTLHLTLAALAQVSVTSAYFFNPPRKERHMNQPSKQVVVVSKHSRRKFLRLAALGGGASLLAATSWSLEARAAGATDALLLSCMDFRLMDDIGRYMSGRGLRKKYDHVVLAGASLGAITDKYPAWNKTFWEHLEIAIKLHNIRTVLVMDHSDCGAYKVILGAEHAKDPKVEKDTHAAQLKTLKRMINEKYPKLGVEMLFMALDGKVEAIG